MVWSPAQRKNWHHLMFLGHVRRMELASMDIMCAPTTTDRARKLAHKINQLAGELDKELRANRRKES